MQISVKKTAKAAGAVCAATGIVMLSALVASGAAIGAVVEGFKSAGSAMKKMLAEEAEKKVPDDGQQIEDEIAEGSEAEDDVTADSAEADNVTQAAAAEEESAEMEDAPEENATV